MLYLFANVTLDTERVELRREGRVVRVRPKVFALLRYLIEHKGSTVTREQLLEDVWGYENYPSTRTVDTHIAKLRAKIGDSGSEPRFILTIADMLATFGAFMASPSLPDPVVTNGGGGSSPGVANRGTCPRRRTAGRREAPHDPSGRPPSVRRTAC